MLRIEKKVEAGYRIWNNFIKLNIITE